MVHSFPVIRPQSRSQGFYGKKRDPGNEVEAACFIGLFDSLSRDIIDQSETCLKLGSKHVVLHFPASLRACGRHLGWFLVILFI